jgi:hypothetical protein
MLERLATTALALTLMTGCFGPKWGTASPDARVTTIGLATFAPESGVTQNVLDECKLERKLPKAIGERSKTPVALAEDTTGGATILSLEIVKIVAPGGGHYSGPKQIRLHGDLHNGGQVYSFDVERSTLRGSGTCNMLGIVVDAIAKDVGKWLKKPVNGAQLGDLK